MKIGLERIAQYPRLFAHKRIGLITNPSGVNSSFRSAPAILKQQFGLAALFGPEHGIAGDIQAGIGVEDRFNLFYGVPEYSLFGSHPRLTREMLDQIELMVFDIQDIGSRFYTYLCTLSDAMEDCGKAGVPVVVLDRPDPIGGDLREGTLLRKKFASIVGRLPIPARHGMTAGEYAIFAQKKCRIRCDLTVIPCSGWNRAKLHAGSWLNPSPNMPNLDCALIYVGTCLFETVNISEGRGTTRPFEMIGAPFLPAKRIADRMNDMRLQGVIFRECSFRPAFGDFKDELCSGIQLHLTDRNAFRPWECGLRLFEVCRELVPEFTVTKPEHLDRLLGDDVLRLGKESVDSLITRGKRECEKFSRDNSDILLYS